MSVGKIQDIVKTESLSGYFLLAGVILAIIVSNTSLHEQYLSIINLPILFGVGNFKTEVSFLSLVNDGLMSLFFLLIGLEMKYHLVKGEYNDKTKLILPAVAAIGGLVFPALIYIYFNYGQPTIRGWAIPIATDTAFVLCILSFYGRKISLDLRVFILGLSLIDDALAVIILAIAYSKTINSAAILICLLCIAVLCIINYLKVKNYGYYLFVGFVLWAAIVEAGIHGTLAGIILALFIPVTIKDSNVSPLKELEHSLHPLVNYIILPVFAFINSEVPIKSMLLSDLYSNISLGIIFGLFIGKQTGVFVFTYIAVKMNYCKLPYNTSWKKYYAVAILSGIGFTLSLFIGGLCFYNPSQINAMRLAVILASLLSAILGMLVLKYETKTIN